MNWRPPAAHRDLPRATDALGIVTVCLRVERWAGPYIARDYLSGAEYGEVENHLTIWSHRLVYLFRLEPLTECQSGGADSNWAKFRLR